MEHTEITNSAPESTEDLNHMTSPVEATERWRQPWRFLVVAAPVLTLVSFVISIVRSVPDGLSIANLAMAFQNWVETQFSWFSACCCIVLSICFVATWLLKNHYYTTLSNIIDERDQEIEDRDGQIEAQGLQIEYFLDELALLRESCRKLSSQLDTFDQLTPLLTSVFTESKHVFVKCVVDLAKTKRTLPEEQKIIAATVVRAALGQAQALFDALTFSESPLDASSKTICCAKIREGDGFRCIYSVSNTPNNFLQSEYGFTDSPDSLPLQLQSEPEFMYVRDLTANNVSINEEEQKLFQQLDVTGFAACPITLQSDYDGSPEICGTFLVLYRHTNTPTSIRVVRHASRLVSEQISYILQFTQTISSPAAKKSTGSGE